MKRNAVLLVHAGIRIGTGGLDPVHLVAENHGGKIQGINAHVKKSAACQGRLPQTGNLANQIAQVGREGFHLADNSASQRFPYRGQHGHIPCPHRLRKKHVLFTGKGDQFPCLPGICRKRLLTENRPFIQNTELYILIVLGMRRGNINQIHLTVCGKFLVGSISLFTAVLFRKNIRFYLRAGGCRIEPNILHFFDCHRHHPGYISCSHDSNIILFKHVRPPFSQTNLSKKAFHFISIRQLLKK